MGDGFQGDRTTAVVVLAPGAVISRYQIVSRLGVGGMGEVYLADDTTLKRRVALKFLAPNLATDPVIRERFMREAQSAAALNHPNIITIYEVSEFQQRVFIAMEYVEGRTLRDMIDQGQLTTEFALQIAIQLCDGLQVAHSKGYVHRDIKPLNIIVDPTNRVRILDFGLAKAVGDMQLTQAGFTLGTVQYMSPEQAQGQETDHRSDIFAAGIVLYEMLTRKLPFQKPNLPATIYSIVHEEPPPMSSHVAGLRAELQQIVSKAMTKDLATRYQHIGEMGADLRKLVGFEQTMPGLSTAAMLSSNALSSATMAVQPKTKSLAVLVLQNLGSEDDDFISYGITEDLIVDLTRIGTIRVAPMRSVAKYKDSDAELSDIAAKLNVSYVLDGSIHKRSNGIRVSAQLVDVGDGSNLWAERWEEPLENLPLIKRSLASGISQALHIGQTIVRAVDVGKPEAEDAEAYEQYLKGKYTFEHKKDKSDVEIALSLYRKALKKEPALLAAKAGIAEVLMHQGQLSEARTELASALAEAQQKGLRAEQAYFLRLQAKVHLQRSEWEAGYTAASQSLKLAQELGDLSGEGETLGVMISILQPQGKFDEALLLFDRVLEISRQLNDHDKLAEALKNMGIAYSRKGDYSRALGLYDESLELARSSENMALQANCLSNIGNVYFFKGDWDAAQKHYTEALAIATRLDDKAGIAKQTLNVGLVQIQRGSYREGLGMLHTAAATFETLGDKTNYGLMLVNISQLWLTLGEIEQSREAAEAALRIGQEINHPLVESAGNHRIAAVHMYLHEWDRANEYLHRALEIARAAKMNRNIGGLELLSAELHYHKKEYPYSRKHAERAMAVAREIGDKPTLCLSEAYAAVLTAAEGLYNAGVRQLRQQQAVAKDLGDPELLLQVETLLGDLLFCSGKPADQQEGKQLLEAALAYATKKELSPDIKRINGILASATPK